MGKWPLAKITETQGKAACNRGTAARIRNGWTRGFRTYGWERSRDANTATSSRDREAGTPRSRRECVKVYGKAKRPI